jgi:FkbM family methyltransferase
MTKGFGGATSPSQPSARERPIDLERLVDDLYRIFLNRPADQGALLAKVQGLRSGAWTPGELIRELIGSGEFAAFAPEFLHRYASEDRRPLFNDCTQYGELHLLLRSWINATASARFVVDVGARGRERSNSYDLLRHFGWRGLLIEANTALIESIRRDFGGLDVEVVNCAVSDFNGRAQFTLGANDDVSSLEASSAASWGDTRGVVDVLVRRLPDLLEEARAPLCFDLLSLDIEGEDVKVLNDLCEDGRFTPTWIFLEASNDFATKSLSDLPTTPTVRRSYEMVGQTKANILLRRREVG